MKKIFVFLFLSIATTTFAQTVEELSQLTYEQLSDSINATFKNFKSVNKFSEAYILKAQRDKDIEKEWQGMEAVFYHHYEKRNIQEANSNYEMLLAFSEEKRDSTLLGKTLKLGGDLQLLVPNTKLAASNYQKSIDIFNAINDAENELISLHRLTFMYQLTEQYHKKINLHKRAANLFENKPLDSTYTQEAKDGTLTYVYYQTASSYTDLKQLDSARYYAKLIKENATHLEGCYKQYYNSVFAKIKETEGNYNEALKELDKKYALCEAKEGSLSSLRKAYDYGNIAMKLENFNEAKRLLAQGLKSYELAPGEEGYMDDYYLLLAEANKHTGNFEKASYYYQKHLNTNEEFARLQNGFEDFNKQAQLKKFEEDLEILKAEKEKNESNFNYLLLGGSLVILLLLFFLLKFYRNKKENEAKFEALLAKIQAAATPKEIIDTKDAELEEKNSNEVSEEVTKQILEGLQKLEAKEYYLKQECNSYNVAKKIGTNTSYLSKVINSHYGKNFNTYINDLRINYAIVRLKNDVFFRSYSIQSIAEEIGYKSADSFTKYFKKDTGLNPSFYIKNIKNVA